MGNKNLIESLFIALFGCALIVIGSLTWPPIMVVGFVVLILAWINSGFLI
jgi:hypothetical protein